MASMKVLITGIGLIAVICGIVAVIVISNRDSGSSVTSDGASVSPRSSSLVTKNNTNNTLQQSPVTLCGNTSPIPLKTACTAARQDFIDFAAGLILMKDTEINTTEGYAKTLECYFGRKSMSKKVNSSSCTFQLPCNNATQTDFKIKNTIPNSNAKDLTEEVLRQFSNAGAMNIHYQVFGNFYQHFGNLPNEIETEPKKILSSLKDQIQLLAGTFILCIKQNLQYYCDGRKVNKALNNITIPSPVHGYNDDIYFKASSMTGVVDFSSYKKYGVFKQFVNYYVNVFKPDLFRRILCMPAAGSQCSDLSMTKKKKKVQVVPE